MPASAALKLDHPSVEPCPVETIEGSLESGVLILCDHASNAVPPDLGDLGLPEAEFQRHIAYDIGAAAVTGRSPAASGARRSSPGSPA
jgi:predicted N-formylglutamate amidohydrolase